MAESEKQATVHKMEKGAYPEEVKNTDQRSRRERPERSEFSGGAMILSEMEEKFERLYEQAQQLITTQFALARAEVSEKVGQIERGAFKLTSGGILAFFGIQGLVVAAIFALALVMNVWASALIVGGVLLVTGGALFFAGKRNLEPKKLVPERTIRSVKKDIDSVKEAV